MLSLLAAVALSQCATGITDNAQNLCGLKTLPERSIVGYNGGDYPGLTVRGSGVLLDGPYSYVQTTGGRTLYMRDSVPVNSSSPSFYFQTANARYGWEEIYRFTNGNDALTVLYGDGTLVVRALRTVEAHSGDPALAALGNYVGVAADFPPNYQGEHGALTVSGGTACRGYNLLQAGNGRSGTGARTDYAFNVSCRGGIYSRDLINSTELPVCDNGLSEPPEPNNRYGNCPNLVTQTQCNFGTCGVQTDGGYCYDWTTFYGPDAGHAKAGETFGFVADVGEGCQCVPAKYDGGASPAGWFKQSDRTECRP